MADKWIQLMSEDGTDNLFPTSKMDLLWTNASPGSSFAAQTINLDLSAYKLIYIIVNRGTASDTQRSVNLCFLTNNNYPLFIGEGGSQPNPYYRGCTVSTSKIIFDNAYLHSSSSVSNGSAIPYQIYGIK